MQTYLEGLTAVHSAVAQADGNRASGLPVRRQEIETIHPLVRVHPATGWKSVYVNPGMFSERTMYFLQRAIRKLMCVHLNCAGFVRRIVGVPKVESDAILDFLFHQISENPDFQVRFKWEVNSVAFWDNRVRVYQLSTWTNALNVIFCN